MFQTHWEKQNCSNKLHYEPLHLISYKYPKDRWLLINNEATKSGSIKFVKKLYILSNQFTKFVSDCWRNRGYGLDLELSIFLIHLFPRVMSRSRVAYRNVSFRHKLTFYFLRVHPAVELFAKRVRSAFHLALIPLSVISLHLSFSRIGKLRVFTRLFCAKVKHRQ